MLRIRGRLAATALLGTIGVAACGSRTDLATYRATRAAVDPGVGGAGGAGGGVGGHVPTGGGGPGGAGGVGPGGGGPGGAGGAGGVGGAGGQTSTAQVISMDPGSILEAETHIAISPATGLTAVAWISVPPSIVAHIGYAFSSDGGATWTAPLTAESPNGRDGSDPVLAPAPDGGFYLTWVGFHRDPQGNPFDMRVYVAHAAAGATTFDEPVAVSADDPNAFYDKPWIATTNQGTAVVTYSRQSGSGLALVASRSADGKAWQESVIAEDPSFSSFRNLAYPCAPKTGSRLWVTYPRMGPNGNVVAIEIVHSDDQGVTWSKEVHVATAPKENLAYEDPTCVAEGDEVSVSYGISTDFPGVETTARLDAIRVARSSDGGQTFDLRLDAHDPGAAPAYLLPALVREDDGALDVVYYAGDLDGDVGALRRARLPAGAAAFEPSVVVDPVLVFNLQRGSPLWLGDYIGATWSAGQLSIAYVTNDSGYSHVAFAAAATP